MTAFGRSAMMATLSRALDAFTHNMLPLTGVMGLKLPMPTMDVNQAVMVHVAQEHGKTLDGADIVLALDKQRSFLLQSGPLDEEESARTAMVGWRLLQDKYARQAFTPLAAIQAIEDGALHVHQLAAPPSLTWWLEEENPTQPLERAIDSSMQLDDIAEHVRSFRPDLFGPPGQSPPPQLPIATSGQLQTIASMISETLRFRQDPYEWVYDGFKPLLLPDVVVTRKGMSVSLSTMILCVMRRLGVTAIPYINQEEAVDLSMIGRQASGPPAPVDIYLCGGTTESPCVINPAKRRGDWVLSNEDAASICAQHSMSWEVDHVFRIWAEHTRTMLIACQRRGESDRVVDWMYQHASLDPARAVYPGME